MSDEIDLSAGVPFERLADGAMLAGQVGGEAVLLVRHGDSISAVGASCTHYSGPLAEGRVVGDTLRCPLHHACFDLRSGEALTAPAFDPLPCWRVERAGATVYVRERLPAAKRAKGGGPGAIVIVGAGAAGLAAAERLRREGFGGSLTMLSADADAPCDRPNLSKDFLAGSAPDEWMSLRPPEFYADNAIELRLGTRVGAIDVARRRVQTEGGVDLPYDALLLATGAEPIKLDLPTSGGAEVLYLRSFADSRAIVAKATHAKRALVLGTSFIGLEVAASLRERGLEVTVVGRDAVPMERVLGAPVGRFVQSLHEAQGVRFKPGQSIARIDGTRVTLTDGSVVDAELVVAGVGVRPALALAERAGVALDRGVLVDEFLQTSVPGIYAAGDIARWPDRHSGERIRVEHWVVAERQGQVVALNMLGRRQRFDAVPFFWCSAFGVSLRYIGHAEGWDEIVLDGSLEARDASVSYRRGGRTLALLTLDRDAASLDAEAAMEAAS